MHATSRIRAFSTDQSGVILRTALRVLEKWKATTEQASNVLRVSRSSISRAHQGKDVELDRDQLSNNYAATDTSPSARAK